MSREKNSPDTLGNAGRYVDILSDAGFKAVFGDKDNSQVLIDFINVIMPPERQVARLEFSTVEIPGFTTENKSIRLDLRCTAPDGTGFIVEMQSSRQAHFFRRCVEYSAKVYDSGSRRGDRQRYDIPPVYFIGIIAADGILPRRTGDLWADRFISSYNFREDVTSEIVDETICIKFVELNRFTKPLKECGTLVEKWCYALRRMSTLDSLPDDLRAQAFERLFRACEIARFSPEKRTQYESDMISERDYYNILMTAKEDGHAEGILAGEQKGRAEGIIEGEARGMAKGREEGIIEGKAAGKEEGLAEGRAEGIIEGEAKGIATVAKAMLDSGMDIARISVLTGLSEDSIRLL